MFEKLVIQYLRQKQLTIAEIDSEIVGVIGMILVPRLNQTKMELYIPELVVSSNYRKMGIGKALINHAISVTKKKKCYRIRLESGHAR
jgi:ribosomal protein S18 acetylase RimI-like enzyme